MNGKLLEYLQQIDKYNGIELSEKYASEARNVAKKKEFLCLIYSGVKEGMLEYPAPLAQHFDCIYFGAILEFMVHEDRTIREDLLKLDADNRLDLLLSIYINLYSPLYIIFMSPVNWSTLSGKGSIRYDSDYSHVINKYGKILKVTEKVYKDIIKSNNNRRVTIMAIRK